MALLGCAEIGADLCVLLADRDRAKADFGNATNAFSALRYASFRIGG